MDNRDREKFYVPPESKPSDESDDEYELEAPDEAIEENRRRLIRESLEPRIDIDEVYREAERDRGSEILENWVRNFRFRTQFQVKHLLIATAVVAIALTLAKLQLFWTAMIVLFMVAVSGLYLYLTLEEKKQQLEADRKRDEIYAKRREQLAPRLPGHVVGGPVSDPPPKAPDVVVADKENEPTESEPVVREPFRFQFSMRDLAITMTIAAVLLGFIHIFGGPTIAPTILGLVAIAGLFMFAMGFQPPNIVVFGWWVILMMYVVVSLLIALWRGFS